MPDFIGFLVVFVLLYAVSRWIDKKGKWKKWKFSEIIIVIAILYLAYTMAQSPA